jgi:predicted nucleic acid-binding protein
VAGRVTRGGEAIPRCPAPVDVDSRIAEIAARIRAATNLKLPDAIHVATAVEHRAEEFLTNDAGFKRASAFLRNLVLDELIADNAATVV